MKRFRKWLFKFLTGFDLIEYEDILHKWHETLMDMRDIHSTNEKLLEHSNECIELTQRAIKHCEDAIAHCKVVLENKTMG